MPDLGFKATKAKVIAALSAGSFQHEARSDIDTKNLLMTGVVSTHEIIECIKRCQGGDHTSSPHHQDATIQVHVLKRDDWYIKFYSWTPQPCSSAFTSEAAMKLFSPGDTSRAICANCARLVGTTFDYRDVPFDDGSGAVKEILVGVCDMCAAVVSIPAQSTPAIRQARETADISLEVVIPSSELEILDAAAYRVDPTATTRFRKPLFAFYLQQIRSLDQKAARLGEDFRDWRNARKTISQKIVVPNKRLSFKIAPRTDRDLQWVMKVGHLKKTEAVRSVVMEIERELVVPDTPRDLKQLQEIAAVVNA